MDNNIKPGEATHLVADTAALENYLSWKPKITWEIGLEKTVKYYVDNKEKYEKAIGCI